MRLEERGKLDVENKATPDVEIVYSSRYQLCLLYLHCIALSVQKPLTRKKDNNAC